MECDQQELYGRQHKATVTYGTQRANFYHILEESLNLRDVRIFDTKEDMQGNKSAF